MRVKRWHVLEKLCNDKRCRKGAEVGVYTGATLFHLLEYCPDLRMVGVDRWEQYPGCAYSDEELFKARRGVFARIELYGGRADILEGDSAEMARWVDNASLDFVFIDADHSTTAVLRDIRAWAPKVKEGGFVSGHDIDWQSVKDAVDQSFNGYLMLPDDVWFAERSDYVSSNNSKQTTGNEP